MQSKNILIEHYFEGKAPIIYLNRTETYNSLNIELLTELRDTILAFEQDAHVRVIGISGKGKAFCSGQNLKDALGIEGQGAIQRMIIDYYNPLVKTIVECQKPVVALVNGPAVGAGAMLALISDFALATETSYFSQAFVNIGLLPDTAGTYFLPKLLGRQMANYLAFTGKKLSSREAKNLGLIAEVFEDQEFEKESLAILEQLANLPTKAISLTKEAFNQSYQNNLYEQLELEGEFQQQASETEDFKEGVSAFLEKRSAKYKGY